TSKVCVVGDFAVGKTSVVERFVSNQFSEKYLSTVGVKIDTKEIEHEDRQVSHKLVIWDVAGSSVFGEKEYA
ncbi:MAG: GTP-binding protein, partial [Pseudomonas stutzeri]|nr:GTP-binding protein [Stutzerimonas stutzeri]